MSRNLVIIKLGGSVITDKSQKKGVFRKDVVKRLANEIKTAWDKQKFSLILVHGAGSFAHPIAKKYRLNEVYLDTQSSEGFAKTKIGVLELNLLVWQELARAGIKACIVEPSAVIKAQSAKIKKFDTKFIEFLLSQDIVPLLSGDVVLDQNLGFSIISGDQIVSFLAKKFKAKKVILVSDVDGVFNKDPKVYQNAKLIREVNTKNYKDIIDNIKMNNVSDVTGEMKGKILSVKKDLAGTKVIITNGLIKGNVLKSLLGNKSESIGTIINF